jgi:hypothetical protein
MISWNPEVVYSVKLVDKNSTPERFLYRKFSNYTCETQGPKTIAVEETKTHSVKVTGGWEVGGSLEWAAGNLFAKCKTTVHAKVTGNEENSDTKEVKVTESIVYTIPPCTKIEYWYDIINHTASYEMSAADAEFVCKDFYTNKKENWTCNKAMIFANGVGHSDVDEGIRPIQKLCDCEDPIEEVVIR